MSEGNFSITFDGNIYIKLVEMGAILSLQYKNLRGNLETRSLAVKV